MSKNIEVGRRTLGQKSIGALLALALASTLLPGFAAAGASKHGACSATSRATRLACWSDSQDDYWITRANCFNLSDRRERRECNSDALEGFWDGRRECRAQYAAREELCDKLGQDPYDPQIDPDDFLTPSEIAARPNPRFPLVPGNVWVYEGGDETITVTVTDETKEILGVECVVVRDVVEEDGELIEDTFDWYAQDRDGNVWYFGEIARNYEDGELADIEGSWTAGVDFAKPGILMKANPQAGDVYRQEYAIAEAEDAGEVVSTTASTEVPAASCMGDCTITLDFTPIEPDTAEHKYYKPGVGLVLEVDLETGERVELVDVNP